MMVRQSSHDHTHRALLHIAQNFATEILSLFFAHLPSFSCPRFSPSSFEMEMRASRAAAHLPTSLVYNLHFNVFRILFFATSAKYGAYIILRYADLSREDCRQHTVREPFNFSFLPRRTWKKMPLLILREGLSLFCQREL